MTPQIVCTACSRVLPRSPLHPARVVSHVCARNPWTGATGFSEAVRRDRCGERWPESARVIQASIMADDERWDLPDPPPADDEPEALPDPPCWTGACRAEGVRL